MRLLILPPSDSYDRLRLVGIIKIRILRQKAENAPLADYCQAVIRLFLWACHRLDDDLRRPLRIIDDYAPAISSQAGPWFQSR